MLNAVLQKQKVTYAKYVAGKQQEIKPINSFWGNQLQRTVQQKELAEKWIWQKWKKCLDDWKKKGKEKAWALQKKRLRRVNHLKFKHAVLR